MKHCVYDCDCHTVDETPCDDCDPNVDRRKRYADAIRALGCDRMPGEIADAVIPVADAENALIRAELETDNTRLRKIAEENKQHYVEAVRYLKTAETIIERICAARDRWAEFGHLDEARDDINDALSGARRPKGRTRYD